MKQAKTNINKLKDQAFKQMLDCGKELEKQIKELKQKNTKN